MNSTHLTLSSGDAELLFLRVSVADPNLKFKWSWLNFNHFLTKQKKPSSSANSIQNNLT
jgi:hypothetical protein